VVLASGGPHHSEIRTIQRPAGYPLTELLSSAMSASGSPCPGGCEPGYKLERCAGAVGDVDAHSAVLVTTVGEGKTYKLRVRLAVEYMAPSVEGAIAGEVIPDEPGAGTRTILGEPYDILASDLAE
jgi:hypothetical protein